MLPTISLYIIIFLYGIVIGSFLNVYIYRIPNKENIVSIKSHCMKCGYPLIELLNGCLYLLVFYRFGMSVDSLLYCLLFSALLTLSVIDFRTYEIPPGINWFIFGLGLIRVITDLTHWLDYAVGLLSVSVFLFLLIIITKGRGMGGGDMKLMAATGIVLGWKCNILAFLLGCIIGSVVHLLRMKLAKEDHVLALGPYLAVGVAIAALWGEKLLAWYMGFLGIGNISGLY